MSAAAICPPAATAGNAHGAVVKSMFRLIRPAPGPSTRADRQSLVAALDSGPPWLANSLPAGGGLDRPATDGKVLALVGTQLAGLLMSKTNLSGLVAGSWA